MANLRQSALAGLRAATRSSTIIDINRAAVSGGVSQLINSASKALRKQGIEVSDLQLGNAFGGGQFAETGSAGGCVLRSGRPDLRRREWIYAFDTYDDTDSTDATAGTGIDVAAGTGILAAFVGATGVSWATETNRRFLLGESDPHQTDSITMKGGGLWMVAFEPVLNVWAWPSGGYGDSDLSDFIHDLLSNSLMLSIDPDGSGRNLVLDGTLLSDIPAGGLTLEADQVFKYQRQSFVQYDYPGQGELEHFNNFDVAFDVEIKMVVQCGIRARFSDVNPFAGGAGKAKNTLSL